MPARSRQLAAIMFTDIVGYTKLMGEDEEKAFELLKKNRSVQRPIIERYNGRWLKEIGDGVLASFNAVSDAVYCAGAIQKACENEPDLKLRIGIHEGEVVFEGDDVFGDGVNIASRLEPLAPIGGILVSEAVHKNVLNKKGIESTFIREEQLRNVREPVKIYSVQVEGAKPVVIPELSATPQQVSSESRNPRKMTFSVVGVLIILLLSYFLYSNFNTGTTSLEPQVASIDKSIVVLPFTDMSINKDQEYFSVGIMEEILYHLVKIEDLKVISRTTAMQYKGTTKSVSAITKELDVATALEGSVRKDGDQVRITVQLIEGDTDMQLWSEAYDREFKDIFAIQSDVAQNVANMLNAKIDPEVKLKIESRPTENLEAYNLWLEGNFIHRVGEVASPAKELWEKTIQVDPNFAPGYTSLGRYWLGVGSFAGEKSREELIQEASYYLERALEIDPEYPYAHLYMSNLHLWYEWDFKAAEKEIEHIRELWSLNWSASRSILDFLNASGKFEEAIKLSEQLVTIDVNNPSAWGCSGLGYYLSGHLEKGNSHFDTALKLFPQNPKRWYLDIEAGRAFIIAGRYERVTEILNGLLEISPNFRFPRVISSLAIAYYHMGETDKASELMKEMMTKAEESSIGSPSFYLAMLYAQIGVKDTAFEWLEKSYQDREVEMYWLKVEPPFKPLYNDSRWQEMLDKVGFPK